MLIGPDGEVIREVSVSLVEQSASLVVDGTGTNSVGATDPNANSSAPALPPIPTLQGQSSAQQQQDGNEQKGRTKSGNDINIVLNNPTINIIQNSNQTNLVSIENNNTLNMSLNGQNANGQQWTGSQNGQNGQQGQNGNQQGHTGPLDTSQQMFDFTKSEVINNPVVQGFLQEAQRAVNNQMQVSQNEAQQAQQILHQTQLNVANVEQTVNSVGPSFQHRNSQILQQKEWANQCGDLNTYQQAIQ